eukprot:TRINITY_DN5111_c0_g1_i1.p1 TRINITY_DN5111_c0_g1~~TRINITY_DN5111_c0_g1_i1.p1  ORF type:complete len:172 (-),score=35.39 TRINITY_DN5111_c0_g1_i1:87-581(-)
MQQEPLTITLKKTIPNATPQQIYDIYLDPQSPGSPWFGVTTAVVQPIHQPATPTTITSTTPTNTNTSDLGLFYHCIQGASKTHHHYGRFMVLDKANGVIEHTWVSEATGGKESVVRITLTSASSTPSSPATAMTLVHSNLPNDDTGKNHEVGWDFILKALGSSV